METNDFKMYLLLKIRWATKKKKTSYFPLYWLFNRDRDPYNGLL